MWLLFLLLFAVVLAVVNAIAWDKRELLIRALPQGLEHRPADSESFTSLDHGKLDTLTAELLALGFARLADLETSSTKAIRIVGFDRVLVHPELGCQAVISQLVQPLVPMECGISTAFAGGSCYTTEDREATWAKWAHRSVRHFWSACPDASPAELLHVHLKKRDQLISGRQLQVEQIDTVPAYTALVSECMQHTRDRMCSRWCLGVLADAIFFRLDPKNEWMG